MTFEPPDIPEMPELEPGDEVGFEFDGRLEYGVITEVVGIVYTVRTPLRTGLFVNRGNVVEWTKQ